MNYGLNSYSIYIAELINRERYSCSKKIKME